LRTAQLGHSVCLIERGTKCWHHAFAQSLAPSALPLLEAIGIREEVEARFARVPGILLFWADERPQYRDFDGAGGFQVQRPTFDNVIRHAAARAGATLVPEVTALAVRRDEHSSQGWIVRGAAGGQPFDIHAHLIVDAAGRSASIPGLRPWRSALRHSLPLLSILGEWRRGRMEARSLIEAATDCWYWAGISGDDSVSVAVFLDPRSPFPERGAPLARTYAQLVKASQLLEGALSGTPIQVTARDATSRHVIDPVGAFSIKVGEAALSVDPLSSQGIQTSLTGALQAAIVLNTWLRRPSRAAAADAFYRERHAEVLQNSRMNSCRIYAEAARRFATPFWSERSGSPSAPHSHAPPRARHAFPDPSVHVRLAAGVQLRRTAVVRNEVAEFVPAIVPAGRDRPVAFVDNVPVGELAGLVVGSAPAVEIVQAWSALVGEPAALRALSWMWQAGVIAADREYSRAEPRTS
jgi:flavin-dependent dehydrogenase